MNAYEFSISLRIRHPRMSSEEISSIVGLVPEFNQSVGEVRRTPKGKVLDGSYSETYCSFKLEEKRLGNVEDHLHKWCVNLSSCRLDFRRIKEGGGRVEFFVGVFLSGNSGIELSVDELISISDLGLNLAFDIYN